MPKSASQSAISRQGCRSWIRTVEASISFLERVTSGRYSPDARTQDWAKHRLRFALKVCELYFGKAPTQHRDGKGKPIEVVISPGVPRQVKSHRKTVKVLPAPSTLVMTGTGFAPRAEAVQLEEVIHRLPSEDGAGGGPSGLVNVSVASTRLEPETESHPPEENPETSRT
jgi:hypothetical protein